MNETVRFLAQNAIDIFAGEWTSAFPMPELIAGSALLAEDPRLAWAIAELNGLTGARVLELGPFEGMHSFMLEQAGAREVIAVEGLPRAYLRCLIAASILRLERVRFECGDFLALLRETTEQFDVVVASGVLYHQVEPIELLTDVARIAPAVYIWTHYFDAERIAANPRLKDRFGPLVTAHDRRGRPYQRAQHRYGTATLESPQFAGNVFAGAHTHWLPLEQILETLNGLGYANIRTSFDEPDHPNGPSIAIVATK